MKKALSITANILFYAVLIAAVVSAIAFALNADERKSVFGYRFYEVLSGSMRPTIDIGELVIVKMTASEDVEVGDIVTKAVSEDGSTTLTHRVIQRYVDESGRLMVVTQGDNNASPDEAIPADALIGTLVFHIPLIGHAVGFVKGNFAYVVFVTVALIAFVKVLHLIFIKNKPPEDNDPERLEHQAFELIEQAEALLCRAEAIRAADAERRKPTFNQTPLDPIQRPRKENEQSSR